MQINNISNVYQEFSILLDLRNGNGVLAQMVMPNSQRYPWTLYRINSVEDIVVFLGLKSVNSDNYYMLSCM